MIITSLWAENVLKYSSLKLADIPTHGLIAISGDNESGKSSIGETICFALFGRTFSLPPEDIVKVIRWGESRCSTKLQFVVADGQRYGITRILDDLGNHGASLTGDGMPEPLARGVEDAESALEGLIGFGYTEFIESFYLAQREITTPHPHSAAVKAMAGVATLERVESECRQEVDRLQKTTAKIQQELTSVQAQRNELAVQPGHLDNLVAQRVVEETFANEKRQRIAELEAFAASYDGPAANLSACVDDWLDVEPDSAYFRMEAQAENLEGCLRELGQQFRQDQRIAAPFDELNAFVEDHRARLGAFKAVQEQASQYRARLLRLLGDTEPDAAVEEKTFATRQAELAQGKQRFESERRRAHAFLGVFLVLTVVLCGVWGLLALAPDATVSQAVGDWLSGNIPQWQARYREWLPYASVFLAVLVVVLGLRSAALSSRLAGFEEASAKLTRTEEDTRRQLEEFDDLENIPLSEATAYLAGLDAPGVADGVSEFVEGPGAPLLDAEQHLALQESLRQSVKDLQSSIADIKGETARSVGELAGEVSTHNDEEARLDRLIADERERVRKGDELEGILRALRAKIDGSQRRIFIRSLATDLLAGACRYVSQRFNHDVRNFAGQTLPQFTDGRYEHLQIDENLRVRVFSNEKRDFMDLDEISSGTQRQIMLAVRLALSQELINTAILGPQTVFLDEPFAFFDERRSAGSLQVLPKVGENITQVWVTSQTFPKDVPFDLHINCAAEEAGSPVAVRTASTNP